MRRAHPSDGTNGTFAPRSVLTEGKILVSARRRGNSLCGIAHMRVGDEGGPQIILSAIISKNFVRGLQRFVDVVHGRSLSAPFMLFLYFLNSAFMLRKRLFSIRMHAKCLCEDLLSSLTLLFIGLKAEIVRAYFRRLRER